MILPGVFLIWLCCCSTGLCTKYCSYEDAENVLDNWNSMMEGGNTAPYMLAIFREVFEKLVRLVKQATSQAISQTILDGHTNYFSRI